MVSPTTDRRLGLAGNTAMKTPVTVLADSNITQSGQQTIDGVAVLASNSAGVPDRVLCTGMTDATKNGVWDVSTAAWTRSVDANGNYDLVQGTTVLVNNGTTYGGSYWRITSTGQLTIGSSLIAWTRALVSALSTLFFLQAGTGAASRGAQDKMREIVSVTDFAANGVSGALVDGTGVVDSTLGLQAALSSGAKIVRGVPGQTYLVSHTGTIAANGANQRYCLLVPTGVLFDLNGATVKAANASNSSPLMLASVTDSGVMNGTVDCNKANQTTPPVGTEIAGVFAYNCTRPVIENIKAINCRIYAGRFYGNAGGRYVNLTCTGSDADGWSFGIDGGGILHVTDAFIDNIYAENCTQVFGGTYQGNPAIFTVKRCNVGKVIGKNSSGAVKIQDSTADSNFGSLIFIGPTNGGVNSGVKIQGNNAGLQPTRVKVGQIHSSNAYGNGLYVFDSLSVEIGQYQGISNGTGGAAAGSDQYDVNLDIPTGGRCIIGAVDVETPGTRIGRAQGAGLVKIGTIYGKTPTGVGFSYNGSGEFYCDDMRIDDGGSAMTIGFQVASGTRGRVRNFMTTTAHSTARSRVSMASPLYDWTIESLRLGSTDVLEGVVQLTSGSSSTVVTCGHIWKEYVGGTADYFQPIIAFEPMRANTRSLNTMYAVPKDGTAGTGFTIHHTAASTADYVFWKVHGWKVGAQPPSS